MNEAIITTDIEKAITALMDEEVIGLPTETVYGLAGNSFSTKATDRIYSIKHRPSFNPLIVHIHSPEQIHHVAKNIPEAALALANTFWPGPLTLVLEKGQNISLNVTGGKDTVAVRIPRHPMALELLKRIPFPLAAPSANPFMSVSPTTAQHVYDYFRYEIGVILDGGPCQRGIESTIIGFPDGRPTLYRHGAVAIEQVERITGRIHLITHNDETPEAPGMLLRHYAPKTRMVLTENVVAEIEKNKDKRIGLLVFEREFAYPNITKQMILSPAGDLEEAARNLYASLHELDGIDAELIIAEQLPDESLGRSINDRLSRAAAHITSSIHGDLQ